MSIQNNTKPDFGIFTHVRVHQILLWNPVADKPYSREYYNLDQIRYMLVLISVSNKIPINTMYLLHLNNIYSKHENVQKVKRT